MLNRYFNIDAFYIFKRSSALLVMSVLVFGCSNSAVGESIIYLVKQNRILLLADVLPKGVHCVFPTGTVVPVGEAALIYGIRKVTAESYYDSSGYWFVVFKKEYAEEVRLVPINLKELKLSLEKIMCGATLRLRFNGVSITVEN